MAKNYGSSRTFTLVFNFLRCFFVVTAVGLTCTAADGPNILEGTSVTTETFILPNRPVWINNCVYFVDETHTDLIKYDLNTGKTTSVQTGFLFFSLVPVKSGEGPPTFVGCETTSVTWFSWDGSSPEFTIQDYLSVVLTGPKEVFVCGKSDCQGRLFLGSKLSDADGKLYMVDNTGKIITAIDRIGIPLDIAWSPDDLRLYILDGTSHTIECYTYDKDKGTIGGKHPDLINFAEINVTCNANAMTMDTGGNLWISCSGARYVVQINPASQEFLTQANIKAPPSNVVFGGETMDDLYITTVDDPQIETSGSLFHVAKTGYKGIAVHEVDVSAWKNQTSK